MAEGAPIHSAVDAPVGGQRASRRYAGDEHGEEEEGDDPVPLPPLVA